MNQEMAKAKLAKGKERAKAKMRKGKEKAKAKLTKGKEKAKANMKKHGRAKAIGRRAIGRRATVEARAFLHHRSSTSLAHSRRMGFDTLNSNAAEGVKRGNGNPLKLKPRLKRSH